MGSLITETPYSEITATLEILDRHGVGRGDLKKFRSASPEVQRHIAHILKTANTCVAISSTSTHSTFVPLSPFSIYLDIEVGGKSKDELLAELESNRCFVSGYAKGIMSKPAWRPGQRERAQFVRRTLRELGFGQDATTTAIWDHIRGFAALCEPADGPAIRLALKDQPRGDCFWCAMEQVTDSGGNPSVFAVGQYDSEPWLGACWTDPDDTWVLDSAVVFRLRK